MPSNTDIFWKLNSKSINPIKIRTTKTDLDSRPSQQAVELWKMLHSKTGKFWIEESFFFQAATARRGGQNRVSFLHLLILIELKRKKIVLNNFFLVKDTLKIQMNCLFVETFSEVIFRSIANWQDKFKCV